MTAISKTEDAIPVNEKITAKLGGVTLDAPPFAAGRQQFDIGPHRPQTPGTEEGALQSIGLIDFSVRIKQEIKCRAGLLEPGSGSRQGSKGYDHDPNIICFEFFLKLTQLCHMLPAGQSTQMPEKDQENILTIL